MSGAAVLIVIAVLLIVVALVVYLVGTILELRKITSGLDEVIGNVGEILQKTEPVNAVVDDINANLDAGVSALEGLLVKKAGMEDAVGLVDGPLPGGRRRGAAGLPRERHGHAAAHRRGLHQGHAHAGAPRPRGADRHGQPGGPGAPQRRGGEPLGAGCSTRTSATTSPEALPRSPVIGTDAPVQYEQREDIGAPRKRLPSREPKGG